MSALPCFRKWNLAIPDIDSNGRASDRPKWKGRTPLSERPARCDQRFAGYGEQLEIARPSLPSVVVVTLPVFALLKMHEADVPLSFGPAMPGWFV
jgi:hypothetical protein